MATSAEAAASAASLVVLAWGNESRGDDGAGPELARRLAALDLPGLVVVEDMQLQIEHTTDLVHNVPVLFIDASVAIEAGFRLERIEPRPDSSVTTHAVSPEALLQLYETTMGQPAPPAWQLHVAGRDFDLGAPPGLLSVVATNAAWRFLEALLARPRTQWHPALERASWSPHDLARTTGRNDRETAG